MGIKRISIKDILNRKGGEPIVCLTAYTSPIAKILDKYVDILLVGDSVGMVLYGMDSTLQVTLDMMINHGKAVVNSSKQAFVVVDMPFGTYQESKEQAFRNAARILSETGCQAVKFEGGAEMAETVEYLVKRGIPVMGHTGMQPQSVNAYGGYKVQGQEVSEYKDIMANVISLQKAGAFSIVIEKVTEALAADISKKLSIPVIGIGASPKCDGQVLVVDDVIGLFTDFQPKFAKQYCNTADLIDKSIQKFAQDVRSRKFPTEENCFYS